MNVGEHALLVVRLDGLERLARPDLLTTDDERDLHPLGSQLLQAALELGALGRAGRVILDRLVAWSGRTEEA